MLSESDLQRKSVQYRQNCCHCAEALFVVLTGKGLYPNKIWKPAFLSNRSPAPR
jgi:hypothetical protein